MKHIGVVSKLPVAAKCDNCDGKVVPVGEILAVIAGIGAAAAAAVGIKSLLDNDCGGRCA